MTEDQQGHMEILGRAVKLYLEKDPVRGSMWREFPPSDKIREMRERIMRIEAAYERGHLSFVKEDAYDLINYAVFLVRQIEEGAVG